MRVKGFRFYFFSREEPRAHVHVQHAEGEATFWIEPTVELHGGGVDRESSFRNAEDVGSDEAEVRNDAAQSPCVSPSGCGGTVADARRRRRAQSAMGPIGLQLFTVRAELQKDFNGALARIAAIGYREVEFAGYFGRSPGEVRAALRTNGLTAVSSHVSFSALGDQWPGTVDAARTIGHQHLVVASIDEASRRQPGAWPRVADTRNRAGEVCKAAGIRL